MHITIKDPSQLPERQEDEEAQWSLSFRALPAGVLSVAALSRCFFCRGALEIDLSQNSLSDESLSAFLCAAAGITQPGFQIATLDLADNAGGDRTAGALSDYLVGAGSTSLARLDLSGNCISSAGMQLLALALPLSTLSELRIGPCEGFGTDPRSLVTITRNISTSQLRRLDCTRTNLGDDGATILALAMSPAGPKLWQSPLKYLNLSYCGISARGAQAFASAIASPSSALEYLILEGNSKLGDAGAVVLSVALAAAYSAHKLSSAAASHPCIPSFRSLSVARCGLSRAGILALAAVLKSSCITLGSLSRRAGSESRSPVLHVDVSGNSQVDACAAITLAACAAGCAEYGRAGAQVVQLNIAGSRLAVQWINGQHAPAPTSDSAGSVQKRGAARSSPLSAFFPAKPSAHAGPAPGVRSHAAKCDPPIYSAFAAALSWFQGAGGIDHGKTPKPPLEKAISASRLLEMPVTHAVSAYGGEQTDPHAGASIPESLHPRLLRDSFALVSRFCHKMTLADTYESACRMPPLSDAAQDAMQEYDNSISAASSHTEVIRPPILIAPKTATARISLSPSSHQGADLHAWHDPIGGDAGSKRTFVRVLVSPSKGGSALPPTRDAPRLLTDAQLVALPPTATESAGSSAVRANAAVASFLSHLPGMRTASPRHIRRHLECDLAPSTTIVALPLQIVEHRSVPAFSISLDDSDGTSETDSGTDHDVRQNGTAEDITPNSADARVALLETHPLHGLGAVYDDVGSMAIAMSGRTPRMLPAGYISRHIPSHAQLSNDQMRAVHALASVLYPTRDKSLSVQIIAATDDEDADVDNGYSFLEPVPESPDETNDSSSKTEDFQSSSGALALQNNSLLASPTRSFAQFVASQSILLVDAMHDGDAGRSANTHMDHLASAPTVRNLVCGTDISSASTLDLDSLLSSLSATGTAPIRIDSIAVNACVAPAPTAARPFKATVSSAAQKTRGRIQAARHMLESLLQDSLTPATIAKEGESSRAGGTVHPAQYPGEVVDVRSGTTFPLRSHDRDDGVTTIERAPPSLGGVAHAHERPAGDPASGSSASLGVSFTRRHAALHDSLPHGAVFVASAGGRAPAAPLPRVMRSKLGRLADSQLAVPSSGGKQGGVLRGRGVKSDELLRGDAGSGSFPADFGVEESTAMMGPLNFFVQVAGGDWHEATICISDHVGASTFTLSASGGGAVLVDAPLAEVVLHPLPPSAAEAAIRSWTPLLRLSGPGKRGAANSQAAVAAVAVPHGGAPRRYGLRVRGAILAGVLLLHPEPAAIEALATARGLLVRALE